MTLHVARIVVLISLFVGNALVQPASDDALTISAMDTLAFDPVRAGVSPGQVVTLQNTGYLQHNLVVDAWGGEMTPLLDHGGSAEFSIPEDAAVGESFEFYCSVPGHREGGMVGTFVIVEPGSETPNITPVPTEEVVIPDPTPVPVSIPRDVPFTVPHQAGISDMVFIPESSFLATAGEDGTVWLRDTADPGQEPVVVDTLDSLLAVTASPDGSRLAAGGWRGNVYLWQLDDLDARPVVLSHTDPIRTMDISADGSLLATGGEDTVALWDLTSPGEQPLLLLHRNPVTVVAFSPDGQTLATGSADGMIRLWDMTDPAAGPEVLRAGRWIHDVAFSPDGRWLAAGDDERTGLLWDLQDSEGEPVVLEHEWIVDALAFSPDGATLVTASSAPWEFGMIVPIGEIRLYEMAAPAADPRALPLSYNNGPIAFSPDGETLAAVVELGLISLLDPDDLEADTVYLDHSDFMFAVISADGRRLATTSLIGPVSIWNLEEPDAAPIQLVQGNESLLLGLAFSPDGQTLATSDITDGTVRLWDLRHPENAPVILPHDVPIVTLAFDAAGMWLAAGGIDGSIWIRDLSRPDAEPVIVPTSFDYDETLALGPGGNLLATSDDSGIHLLNPAVPAETPRTLQYEEGILAIAFSADGQRLAAVGTGDDVPEVLVWELSQPSTEPTVFAHQPQRRIFPFSAVTFSPDGQRVASAYGEDVLLWDVNDPAALPLVMRHGEEIVSGGALVFSPDGRRLMVAGSGGTVSAWDLPQPSDEATPVAIQRRPDRWE